jgi:hypothetical protein
MRRVGDRGSFLSKRGFQTARLFSCCSSAFFIVFVTLFMLGFLAIGIPGMADEPIPPPGYDNCTDNLEPDCDKGNPGCGDAVPCCLCYFDDGSGEDGCQCENLVVCVYDLCSP